MLFYLELIQLAHLFFAYFFFIVQQNKFIHAMYKMHFQFYQTKIPFFFPFHPRFRFVCDLCKIVLPNANDVCSFKEKLINHGY